MHSRDWILYAGCPTCGQPAEEPCRDLRYSDPRAIHYPHADRPAKDTPAMRANRHLPSGRNLVVNDPLTDSLVRHFGDELHGLGLRRFTELRELVEAGTPMDEAYALVARDRRPDCDC